MTYNAAIAQFEKVKHTWFPDDYFVSVYGLTAEQREQSDNNKIRTLEISSQFQADTNWSGYVPA